MSRILAIGDTHMNTSAICNVAIPQAVKHGCDTIMQLGDFGMWEHEREGERFLHKVSTHLVKNDLELFWIDGNHDNHPLLWEKYPPVEDEFGFCPIRPNLWYVPRGTVWEWGEVRCLGLGGAWSIDSQWRLQAEKSRNAPGTLWWPTEMIREQDVADAIRNLDGLTVDIMFTHDCPSGPDIPGIHAEDKWRWPQTWTNRDSLRRVYDAAAPQLLVHGHYHTRYTYMWTLPYEYDGELKWRTCRVEGLANDGLDGFGIVLDLDELFPQY